ncbi:PilZ domain-containing protein [Sphingomonas gellani]|uniref:PilZ domain-containing protein n=1 Tax=Sphingomonas gellani TaxID=1166340 RepID=A0A1H8IBB0_9SPHN|nr:PilZ domain-containing protein [Sphingomonas gellani]SEN65462.1 PilZ domain-containing protein [Sphingomonas gellani]
MAQVTGLDTATGISVDEATCRRTLPRATIARPSTLRAEDAVPLDVTVEDLSIAGFRFSSADPIAVGTPVRVGLAGAGRADAEVAWRKGTHHGCLFTSPLTPAAIEAAFTNAVSGATATIAPRVATTSTPSTAGTWRIAGSARFLLVAVAGASIWGLVAVALRLS